MKRRSGQSRRSGGGSIEADRYVQLFEALSPLVGSRSVPEITALAAKIIADLLQVEACSIFLHDAAGRVLVLRGSTHIEREKWPEIHLPIDSGVCGHTFRTGSSLLLRKAEDFLAFGLTPDRRYGRPSCVVAPIVVRGRVEGVINIANLKSGRTFNERDVRVIEAAARLIAGGIQNAYQFEETARVHHQLEELFDGLHVALLVLDSGLHLTQCNRRFEVMMEQTEESLRGRPLRQVLEGPLFHACRRAVERARAGDPTPRERLQARLGRRDLSLEVTASRLNPSPTAADQFLLTLEDVIADEEIRRLREADSIKGGFLRTISHELRTPLTVIRGALPLLKKCRESDNGESVETLARLERAVDANVHKLTSLVNAILGVVELENGTLQLLIRPVELNPLIEERVAIIHEQAILKGLELRLGLAPNLPPVAADPQHLSQIINELLDNAVKFSSRGGAIRIETGREGAMATMTVANRGETIAPESREAIFEKFYQIDQSSTRRTGGAGLGLYLTREILRMHGGAVQVVDGEAGETVFLMRLPLASVSSAAPSAVEGGF